MQGQKYFVRSKKIYFKMQKKYFVMKIVIFLKLLFLEDMLQFPYQLRNQDKCVLRCKQNVFINAKKYVILDANTNVFKL